MLPLLDVPEKSVRLRWVLAQATAASLRLQPRAAAVTPGPHSLAVKDGKGSLGKAPLVLKMLQQPGEAFV